MIALENKDDIYCFINEDNLKKLEEIFDSKEFRRNHRKNAIKKKISVVIKAVLKWLGENAISLLAILISLAAFIKSFF